MSFSPHNNCVSYSYPYVIDKEAVRAKALPKVTPWTRTLSTPSPVPFLSPQAASEDQHLANQKQPIH